MPKCDHLICPTKLRTFLFIPTPKSLTFKNKIYAKLSFELDDGGRS